MKNLSTTAKILLKIIYNQFKQITYDFDEYYIHQTNIMNGWVLIFDSAIRKAYLYSSLVVL